MTTNLASAARELQLRFVLFSFTDLFGIQRAKLVPASALEEMERDGAGFAGFAAWLDLSPADGDVMAVPDPASLMRLPWQRVGRHRIAVGGGAHGPVSPGTVATPTAAGL